MSQYWFISEKRRNGSKLALFTFMLAFVVIMLGAYTRLTDAGLSCPDWPNCFGYLTAPHTMEQMKQAALQFPTMTINVKKAWTEMTHRYFAGTEGILILILAFSILFRRQRNHGNTSLIGYALITLLAAQIALGMLTVTEKLRPVIVLSHLLTGISILSLLWWAYLEITQKSASYHLRRSSKLVYPSLGLALLVVFSQITLGGWVSTHYAGLACIDFPYCNGNIIPTMQWHMLNTDLITIHMLHRIGALVTATYLSLLSLLLMRNKAFRPLATIMLSILALQVTLGILNIIWLRPVWIAMIHQSVAILLLLTVITALVKASQISGRRNGF